MAKERTSNLAVLVDADNAQPKALAEILTEVARYGTATVKRAYGDWTTPNLNGWKQILHVHAVQPMQQFRYTTGKNATDSALIIDAMDLLHGGRVDGFCLVSSDSDFTRLATRIREAGLSVYGFGEEKTPEPFVKACDKFVYTEILVKPPEPAKPAKAKPSTPTQAPVQAPLKSNVQLKEMFAKAVTDAAREDGWAFLAEVGALLNKIDPSFDSRNFGYKKLGDLARAQPYLEVKGGPAHGESSIMQVLVRLREA